MKEKKGNMQSNIIIGNHYLSNNFGSYIVLNYIRKDKNRRFVFNIRFDKTGYETEVNSLDIKSGEIKDYLLPNFLNIGYIEKPINFFEDREIYKKLITNWENILNRCYNKEYKYYSVYGGKNITVNRKWHSFWNFYNDVQLLPNWDKQKFLKGIIELDKDFKQQNIKNKIYSNNTCMWLSKHDNRGFTINVYKKLILGISPDGKNYKFQNMERFAQENNLTSPNIYQCLQDSDLRHKGWRFVYIQKEIL